MKKAEIAFDTVIKFILGALVLVLIIFLLMSAYEGPRENIEECPGECRDSCRGVEVSWGSSNSCPDDERCCVSPESFRSE